MSALAALRNLAWVQPTKTVAAPPALVEAAKEIGADLSAEFVVKMPTSADIAFIGEAEARSKNVAAMIEIFAADGMGDKAEAMKAAYGLDGSPPQFFAKQVEYLLRCVESPKLDREDVLWISRAFPTFFAQLFVAALELTEGGATLGKLPVSTPIPALEQP